MYSQQITAEMATAHRRDLIAAAEAGRLARQASRRERRAATPRRRPRLWTRAWTRSTTQPAHI